MIKHMLASESKPKVLALFALVTAGILSKWFWNLGWTIQPLTGWIPELRPCWPYA